MNAHPIDSRDPAADGPQAFGTVATVPGLAPGFTSRFLHVNGVRLHVVTGGTGPPLMLVGGCPTTPEEPAGYATSCSTS